MTTIVFEVKLNDNRTFRVFCRGKNQVKRFAILKSKLESEIKSVTELVWGIHNISEFENIAKTIKANL